MVRRREVFEAFRASQDRKETEQFRAEDARLAGIGVTISQGGEPSAPRSCRCIREAKANLQLLVAAAAIGLACVGGWSME